MLRRQRTGAVLCPSCGKLVGVRDEECLNCGRKNPGMWGFSSVLRKLSNNFGFVSIVTWGCAALYIATLLWDPKSIRMNGMSILSPGGESLFVFGASGAIPVLAYGRWWTILSAAWLHGGLLHIFFNMLWVRQLAPAAADLYGISRTAIIYTISSATGFLLSSVMGMVPIPFLRGSFLTVGASAPIFGLLGALVAYGRRGGSSYVSGQAMSYAAIMFVFGFIMPNTDNYAHLGGFLGGYLTSLWLNHLQPEKMSHFIAAIVCVVLTALSIFASILTSGIL
jgi:rhomboid protease GluP